MRKYRIDRCNAIKNGETLFIIIACLLYYILLLDPVSNSDRKSPNGYRSIVCSRYSKKINNRHCLHFQITFQFLKTSTSMRTRTIPHSSIIDSIGSRSNLHPIFVCMYIVNYMVRRKTLEYEFAFYKLNKIIALGLGRSRAAVQISCSSFRTLCLYE